MPKKARPKAPETHISRIAQRKLAMDFRLNGCSRERKNSGATTMPPRKGMMSVSWSSVVRRIFEIRPSSTSGSAPRSMVRMTATSEPLPRPL